jgi:hypothetical protein
MFESIDIRLVANGYVIAVTDDEGDVSEHICDTPRKVTKFVRDRMTAKVEADKVTA